MNVYGVRVNIPYGLMTLIVAADSVGEAATKVDTFIERVESVKKDDVLTLTTHVISHLKYDTDKPHPDGVLFYSMYRE